MHIRQLEHLIAVAETGSFSRAAERLHLTQSALSRSIQSLEEELGGRLIDRVGKRNEATPLGQHVVARARQLVLEASDLRRSAELVQRGEGGSMRIGLGSGPGAVLGVPLLVHMARHHPSVRVSITRGPTELQLQQLRARDLDALVVDMRRVAPAPDLSVELLGDMRAGFVCRAGHPLMALPRVSLSALLDYPIASTPLSDEVGRLMVEQLGPRADPAQFVSLRCDDVETLIQAVEQSDAVFLGILAAAQAGVDAGRLAVVPLRPALKAAARFAHVTLAGRTEAPVMAILRRFAADRMGG